MKLMKRALTVILCISMALSALTLNISAENPVFDDVSPDAWYYSDVMTVASAGAMSGTGEGTFSPEAALTRAMIAELLWRLEGSPKGFTSNFNDVAASAWYYNSVSWAQAKGLVSGVGDNRFDPDKSLSREQMLVLLFRYAGSKGFVLTQTIGYSSYSDADKVAEYASDALKWALGVEILHITDNMLRPGDSAIRADVAMAVAFILTSNRGISAGTNGTDGADGKSAYELAKENGYTGTVQQWLASLVGANGEGGESAYEIAVRNGYVGYSNIIEGAPNAELDGHKYYVIKEKMSWEDAKEYCEKLGGHLATVTSAEEQAVVANVAKKCGENDIWLGASDCREEGVFEWVTGEEWSYSNWSKGEPNNGRGIENYLGILLDDADLTWNDFTTSSFCFVLETEPTE